jgi:hypothetical protein
MIKKIGLMAIVSIFILSAVGAYADQATLKPTVPPVEKTKDRASRAMNNLLCGPVEMPDNIGESQTKGTEITKCSKKTRTGVERGIARMFAGVWQLATFWYSDPDCVTSTKSAANVK